MRRVQDYLRFMVWQSGLGYAALWIVTFWTLDFGPAIFGKTGCHPDAAKVLFYWVCDPSNPLAFMAMVANTALTATIWAPVYIAAATVRPEAISIAAPILAVHLIGLPAVMFVAIRLMLQFFLIPRRIARRMQKIESGADDEPIDPSRPMTSLIEARLPRVKTKIKARSEFGLRGPYVRA